MPERLRGAIATLLLACALRAQGEVAAPAQAFGFEPGTDCKLADYAQICAWFERTAAASDRVEFSSIGKTTEGRDLFVAIITSRDNLAKLEAIRQANLALADPRKLKPGDAQEIVDRGKTIVCINASIHSSEVGPTQAMPPLAHFLATTQDPAWLRVLDDVVIIMTPCHNPDGYEKQVAWYRKWVGTPHEGCPLPGLYHRYAGHDNNRDWFMFNLEESRLTVERIYRRWLPHIVMDLHQMQDDGPRMFMPPYQDPVEPNVPPLLVERLNELGETVRGELLALGLTGVVNRSLFDAWSPSRAYMHYHGGARFLVEVASAKLASPIERRGLARRATQKTESNPAPWSGDRWTLGDIVRYHDAAAKAVLRHASRNRGQWLKHFYAAFAAECASTAPPAAYLIAPPKDGAEAAYDKLVDVLSLGGLEASFGDDGTIAVPRGQPFFAFARALLDDTPYPVIRAAESGPIRKPYDVTAHALPRLMNLGVSRAEKAPRLAHSGWPKPRASQSRSTDSIESSGARVALYDPAVPNVMDAGWLRLFLRNSRIPHRLVDDKAVAAIDRASADVLILPSLSADMILNGNRGAEFPPKVRGGIGDAGATAIDRFVRDGGTLIAVKDATALPIRLFKLPIENALANPPQGRRPNVPGAILRLDVDGRHPIGRGMDAAIPALFESGKAFVPSSESDRDLAIVPVVAARWSDEGSLLIGGYAEGLDLVANKAAIVECAVGRGRVVLFAFSPHFRCQTWATFPLLRNAIR